VLSSQLDGVNHPLQPGEKGKRIESCQWGFVRSDPKEEIIRRKVLAGSTFGVDEGCAERRRYEAHF